MMRIGSAALSLWFLVLLSSSSSPWANHHNSSKLVVMAVVICPTGGVCPNGNTCCSAVPEEHGSSSSTTTTTTTTTTSATTCITGNKDRADPPGTCCARGGGACAGFYHCIERRRQSPSELDTAASPNHTTTTSTNQTTLFLCQRKQEYADRDDKPEILPRYKPCQVPPSALERVYGLPMNQDDDNNHNQHQGVHNDNDNNNTTTIWLAPYYSTLGPLDTLTEEAQQRIETVLISVHGSTLNADDYLCCTNSALPPRDQDPRNSTVLLIAPWFPSPEDAPSDIYDHDKNVNGQNRSILLWRNRMAPMPEWLPHAYRYGADSIQGNVSSFGVMDQMMSVILELELPRLKRIVLTGHSAGGQYVQRWALLSNHSLLTQYEGQPTKKSESPSASSSLPSLRVVVGNPKSYCYLDPRRYNNDAKTFQVPSEASFQACPLYNEWTWGLNETSHTLPTPYKTRALYDFGIVGLVRRYKLRPLVYLSGHLDVLTNGDCMDQMQGPNRRERSRRYFAYLQTAIYPNQTVGQIHHRVEVPEVHHDHCLLYQSEKGQQALFGENLDDGSDSLEEFSTVRYGGKADSHLRSRRFDHPKENGFGFF